MSFPNSQFGQQGHKAPPNCYVPNESAPEFVPQGLQQQDQTGNQTNPQQMFPMQQMPMQQMPMQQMPMQQMPMQFAYGYVPQQMVYPAQDPQQMSQMQPQMQHSQMPSQMQPQMQPQVLPYYVYGPPLPYFQQGMMPMQLLQGENTQNAPEENVIDAPYQHAKVDGNPEGGVVVTPSRNANFNSEHGKPAHSSHQQEQSYREPQKRFERNNQPAHSNQHQEHNLHGDGQYRGQPKNQRGGSNQGNRPNGWRGGSNQGNRPNDWRSGNRQNGHGKNSKAPVVQMPKSAEKAVEPTAKKE